MLEWSVPEGLHPLEDTLAGAISEEELQPTGKTHCCGRGPMMEQGEDVRNPLPEEEQEVETMCDELTASPILLSSCTTQEGGGREISEVTYRKKGRVGGSCLRFSFYFSLC